MAGRKSSTQIEILSATQSEKQTDRQKGLQTDRDDEVNRQTIRYVGLVSQSVRNTELESLRESD